MKVVFEAFVTRVDIRNPAWHDRAGTMELHSGNGVSLAMVEVMGRDQPRLELDGRKLLPGELGRFRVTIEPVEDPSWDRATGTGVIYFGATRSVK